MAWYQRAKERARIRELESELEELTERYAELVNILRDVLEKLNQGAMEEAFDLLRTQYEGRRAELKERPITSSDKAGGDGWRPPPQFSTLRRRRAWIRPIDG